MIGARLDRVKLELDRLIALAGLTTALLMAIIGLLLGFEIDSFSPHPEEPRSGVSKDAPAVSEPSGASFETPFLPEWLLRMRAGVSDQILA